MNILELGKFTISPFELERILELKMVKTMNDHATLSFRGIVKDGVRNSDVVMASRDTKVRFSIDDKVVFSGVLKNINVTSVGSVYYLDATVLSNTSLLDIFPMQRSFQENGRSFESIAEELIQESNGKMHFNAPSKSVENITLQYNETNWEFIKRLASYSSSVLTPVVDSDVPEFRFGVDDVEYKEMLEAFDYSMGMDMEMYWKLSQSESLGFTEQDAIVYTIKSDKFVLEVGDMVSINGKALHVLSEELVLEDSVLNCTYTLVSKKAISVQKIFNEKFIGLTLSGTVLNVINDTVKVHLHIDEVQNVGTAYQFLYATNYSNENHTGWYVMPELGDTVQIFFPTENENTAYANTSLRQADTSRTTDPRTKYLRTADGKEIKLAEREIVITAKDETTFIKINEDSGIEIVTDKDIKMCAGGNIIMNAGGYISSHARGDELNDDGDAISVIADKGDIKTIAEIGDIKTIAEIGGIETTAETGDIKTTAETGDIKTTAETGDIKTTAETGDIKITADKGTIKVTAYLGSVKTKALKKICMKAGIKVSTKAGVKVDTKAGVKVSTKAGVKVDTKAGKKVSTKCLGKITTVAKGKITTTAGKAITTAAKGKITTTAGKAITTAAKGKISTKAGALINTTAKGAILTASKDKIIIAAKGVINTTAGDAINTTAAKGAINITAKASSISTTAKNGIKMESISRGVDVITKGNEFKVESTKVKIDSPEQFLRVSNDNFLSMNEKEVGLKALNSFMQLNDDLLLHVMSSTIKMDNKISLDSSGSTMEVAGHINLKSSGSSNLNVGSDIELKSSGSTMKVARNIALDSSGAVQLN